MIEVILYTRPGCHLCEETQADLRLLQDQFPHRLTVIDIDQRLDLVQAFDQEFPVVEIGPYRLKAPITRQELQVTLGAAQDRRTHMEHLANLPEDALGFSHSWTKADGFTSWFSRHYLAILNLFVFIYVGLPFLAPVLMKAGVETPARLIYRGYGLACHQLGYRSFFLFGEQAAYPRRAAGVDGILTFEQATGIDEGNTGADILAARNFLGNPAIGYKVGLCERDVAIYGSIVLFGLLYALTGRRIPGLPWYLWVLIGLVPVGLDGVSQLLSQPPFSLIPYRESTPFLRALTGFLFGFATAWFGYPMVEESMSEARELMLSKRRRIEAWLARPTDAPKSD